MQDTKRIAQITQRYQALNPVLNERLRRQWAASEAQTYGWGGIVALNNATGLAMGTIRQGIKELKTRAEQPNEPISQRQRRAGGGRKRLTLKNPLLAKALDDLVDPVTRGDPMSTLRWTCKSTSQLADTLNNQGHVCSAKTVGTLLNAQGYSLQGNRKTKEGSKNPDRNAQFEYINNLVKEFQVEEQPVISVDAKKKELVGDFKNAGREWQPEGQPEEVRVYDFLDKKLGKAIPYGVYDVTENTGWVSVGIDHDTARFAVETISRWWEQVGKTRYPNAKKLLVTADGGGSNGSRNRLWKLALQEFADLSGLILQVCHFPPGTSKWNKIEHRMFCHITMNWRGRPLVSHEVVVNLIVNTTTRKGLKIRAELDEGLYAIGTVVSKVEMAGLKLERAEFHGEWNYVLHPREIKN